LNRGRTPGEVACVPCAREKVSLLFSARVINPVPVGKTASGCHSDRRKASSEDYPLATRGPRARQVPGGTGDTVLEAVGREAGRWGAWARG
jgi:hypothetical protein